MKKQINLYGRTVNINALKNQIVTIENELDKLIRIKSYMRQLYNDTSGNETSSTVYVLFGAHALKDEKQFLQDVANMSIPDPITADPASYKPVFDQINEIFLKHVYVEDNRKTPEQRAAERAAAAEREAAAKAEHAEREAYNKEHIYSMYDGEEEIAVPDGMAAVVIGCYYDGSDIITDYFNRHCKAGEQYIIGMVDIGTRNTENLNRQFTSGFPFELSQNWEWQPENRLEKTIRQQVKVKCNGYDSMPCYLAVTINKWVRSGKKSKLYQELVQRPAAQPVEGVTLRINSAKNGIEVYFPGKPSDAVLTALKSSGFHWAKFSKCWYKKDTAAARAAAEKITGATFPTGTASPNVHDDGGDMLDAMNEQAADIWAAQNL